MNFIQTIVWTALPKEVTTRGLILSVFVSPRLRVEAGDGENPQIRLANFPDFQDWPRTVTGKQFRVEFYNDGITNDADPNSVPRFPANADAQLFSLRAEKLTAWREVDSTDWKSLISSLGEQNVNSFKFKAPDGVITYSHSTLAELLKSYYTPIVADVVREAAANPDLFENLDLISKPPKSGLAKYREVLSKLNMAEEEEADLLDAIDKQVKAGVLIDINKPPSCFKPDQWHWALLRYTLNKQFEATHNDKDNTTRRPMDFHQMVSSLGQYPDVLRKFGLVVDLAINFAAGAAGETQRQAIEARNIIRVQGQWGESPDKEDAFPWTKYSLRGNRFLARSRSASSEFVDGMLNLQHKVNGKSSYYVTQVDVVANAPNFRQQAPSDSLAQEQGQAVLPPLRTTGIALSWSGLGKKVDQKLQGARKKNDELSANKLKEQRLFIEDLVRGYRIDVLPTETNQWSSLCRRRGTYDWKRPEKPKVDDEGWVSIPGIKARDEKITIQESMFWWAGWSLCVPRPESPMPNAVATSGTPSPLVNVSFEIVPNSLPRLRFGKSYRFRARLVDMAGNSLGHDDPQAASNPTVFSDSITYGRLEPVTAPSLLPRKSLDGKHGETLTRVVIRTSNVNSSAATAEVSERHIAPPQTSELMAETHGKFDRALRFAAQGDTAQLERQNKAYTLIKSREGSLTETFADVNLLDLPYLPDPFSLGVRLKGLPGDINTKSLFFYPSTDPNNADKSQWPAAKPMRIKLMSTAAGIEVPSIRWMEAQRELRVLLPRGEASELSLTSILDTEDLKRMGLWLWAEGAVEASELEDAVARGCHWMFTPCRTISLVHAVQQPVFAPRNPESTTSAPSFGCGARQPNATFVDLVGKLGVPGRTADKLEFIGSWVDWWDDALPNSNPKEFRKTARAFEITLEPQNSVMRFEPAPAAAVVTENQVGRHEFGDTKHRVVTYTAEATTRFRDCFPPDTQNLTTASQTFDVRVPNTARPPAPDVFYVIPTFAKTKVSKDVNTITGKRVGGGLRLYLRRPWYVSGNDEKLGVVLFPGRLADAPPEVLQYISQWGRDPVWESQPIRNLTPAHFTAGLNANNITLPELPKVPLTVVPHDLSHTEDGNVIPSFDGNRNLWFCDINIAPVPSHLPFIRLALVRYQKESIPGADVSKVILADFVQLTPTRSVTVMRQTGSKVKISLVREESVYKSTDGTSEFPPIAIASFESRPKNAATDLTWEPASEVVLAEDGPLTWTGELTLPSLSPQSEYRFVFCEYETYKADDEFTAPEDSRRLIYSDELKWTGW